MAINETVRPRWSSGIAGEWWWSRLARLARCRRRVRRLHLRVVVSLVTAALFSGTAQAPALSASRETVVLIHGLGGNAWNFQLLAGHLERAGYSVRRLEYDSRAESLDLILEEVDRPDRGLLFVRRHPRPLRDALTRKPRPPGPSRWSSTSRPRSRRDARAAQPGDGDRRSGRRLAADDASRWPPGITARDRGG